MLSRHERPIASVFLRDGLIIEILFLRAALGRLFFACIRLVLHRDVRLVLGEIIMIWMHLQL